MVVVHPKLVRNGSRTIINLLFRAPGDVEKMADKVQHKYSEATLESIRKDISCEDILCSEAEEKLKSCLDRHHASTDPSSCDLKVLVLSECLKRPGQRPGTNPDFIL